MAKRGNKFNTIKVYNKQNSKLEKRGKVKGKSRPPQPIKKAKKNVRRNGMVKTKKRNDCNDEKRERGSENEDECDPTDMFESNDLNELKKTFPTTPSRLDFTSKSKRKHSDDEESEEEYESQPRKWFGLENDGKLMKMMLPIKQKSGIINQYVEVETGENTGVSEEPAVEANDLENGNIPGDLEIQEQVPLRTTVELYATRDNKLMMRKMKIANLATKVLENPQENTKYLKELRLMMDEKDQDVFLTVRKLVMASLLEVFKDILPQYRYRIKSDPENQKRLKKETFALQNYEETVLRHYKAYLERLEMMLQGLRTRRKKKKNLLISDLPVDAAFSLGLLALKCLCELLVTHPNFNYRNTIIQLITPHMNHQNSEISDHVCSKLEKVFKQDKLGDISLECVKVIALMIKQRNFDVQPAVLRVLLSLRVAKAIAPSVDGQKQPMTREEKMQKLSRKERKRSRQMVQLEHELRETEAEESKQQKTKFQTDMLSRVFVIYFKVLKSVTKSALLSSVLEGLARFAHLINIEFFDDLVSVIYKLIGSSELTYRENMHCIQTVFTIISGQGSALNIDPLRFYTELYKHLFCIHSGNSNEDVPILLTCLDLMFTRRRKQVTFHRILAVLKRLCIVCLQVGHDGAIALLMFIRHMMQVHRRSDILLDTDKSQGCSGVYLPELEEPEHCNANATTLWEMHILTRHYHPIVGKLCNHILQGSPVVGEGQLPLEMVKQSPMGLWTIFDSSKMDFQPPLQKPEVKKTSKKKKVGMSNTSFLSQDLQQLTDKALADLSNLCLDEIDFSSLLSMQATENV